MTVFLGPVPGMVRGRIWNIPPENFTVFYTKNRISILEVLYCLDKKLMDYKLV